MLKKDSKLVKEISRVLKKSGKVISTMSMQNRISFPFLSEEEIETINESLVTYMQRIFFKGEIVKLFKDNNLVTKKVSKIF